MGRIQVLDETLSNMIAAGEVVERPASVVKELVENAIDAQATRVEIHVEEGGLQVIRVIDNGYGMDREDCVKAFERHATSKIRHPRDLFNIRTLGFRGEALPSIASVSRVELISTEGSGQVGTRLSIEGGQITQIEDTATVRGTQITVRDLFYNTPARLKYVKSVSTEVGHISDYVNRLALTHPTIAFTLTHNGNTLLQTSGDGKLLHVMAAIYGVQVAKLLLPIEGETLDFRWHGFLSRTEVTRANRSYISTLINGRYVRSYPLANAILRGYHTLLPVGRYPIVALHVEMDPVLVDVNVHPAKLEARFSKEQELCQAIEQSVQETLRRGLTIIRPMQAERQPKRAATEAYQPQLDLRPPVASLPADRPPKQARIREALYAPVETAKPDTLFVRDAREAAEPPIVEPGAILESDTRTEAHAAGASHADPVVQVAEPGDPARPASPAGTEPAASPPVPVFYPVGQVHGTYIVAQNETGMYLIDQHAAQERIYYELFMAKLAEEAVASQMLLFPHTVECTAAEEERLRNRLDLLRSFGLEIEWFGNRTFIVRAHPQWFPAGSELDVIDELIQFVLEAGEKEIVDIRRMRERAAIMMSCKASIKANQYLTHEQMEALLDRLRSTTSPFTCPHGRPIIIHFSTYDLEKMFKRVM